MTLEDFYFKYVKIKLPNGETVSPSDREIDRELLRAYEKDVEKRHNYKGKIEVFGTGGGVPNDNFKDMWNNE